MNTNTNTKTKQTVYAPKYYKKFKCIADRCRHSCCVGWEIDIDSESEEKYSRLCGGYGENIKKSIARGDGAFFKLDERERCPHLDENGLCRIITELGEGYLCEICREHPRFYNRTLHGLEVGLGMACEEACRLILSEGGYDEIIAVSEAELSEDGSMEESDDGFDAVAERKRIYSVLALKDIPYSDKLSAIYREYGVYPDILSDGEARELLESLEYLDEWHKKLFGVYSLLPCKELSSSLEEKLERALAYFIFRHCSSAQTREEFCSSLGFCIFCERLLASSAVFWDMAGDMEFAELARVVSEELEYSEDNTEGVKWWVVDRFADQQRNGDGDATGCNGLQRIATDCNGLQRIVTDCNGL